MPTVHLEASLSSEDLLKAVKQLDTPELERFVDQLIDLRAQRTAPNLSSDESELLVEINRGLPADLAERYGELIARRKAGTLTRDEHAELLRLTDQVERLEAERVEHLTELAGLRKTSLSKLMEDLGIQPAPNA